jgi:P pilus assembly chaperone PapD
MLRRLAPIVLLLGAASSARAAGLQVTPVLVELSRSEPRVTVLIQNVADAPARFEVTASAWDQTADGQMRLAPAPEIVVYPPLLELKPQEQRKVRISTTAAFGDRERAFRVFFRELPPPETPADRGTVRILTKVGIPVFLVAARPEVKVEIAGASVHTGRIAVTLKNTGNTRLQPSKVKIEGTDERGKSVFAVDADVWYVLAGGERALDVPLPADGCSGVRTVEVKAPVGESFVRARVEAPGGVCGP